MAKFVNYGKRSVGLPPGCKDLIDVLQRGGKLIVDLQTESYKRATVTRDDSTAGPISDIVVHLQTLFSSKALLSVLSVRSSEDQFDAHFMNSSHDRIRASVMFLQDSDRERAVRGFLKSRGLKDLEASGLPITFFPNMPVHVICEISPLSADAVEVAHLLLDLFRHLGFADDAEMMYHYHEISNADG